MLVEPLELVELVELPELVELVELPDFVELGVVLEPEGLAPPEGLGPEELADAPAGEATRASSNVPRTMLSTFRCRLANPAPSLIRMRHGCANGGGMRRRCAPVDGGP